MSLFKSKLLNVKSQTGTWTNGKWVPAALSGNTQIRCTIQPVSGKEMDVFPEGRRDKESYKVYANDLLKTVSDGNVNPDIIVYNNSNYEVFSRFDYTNKLISHYKYYVQKVNAK